ncbi:MAG: hypothetical protein ACRDQX_01100 [Pseudonocardiaceae bacterium]
MRMVREVIEEHIGVGAVEPAPRLGQSRSTVGLGRETGEGVMLYAFGFARIAVVMGDLYFVDPDPLPGQEGAERG